MFERLLYTTCFHFFQKMTECCQNKVDFDQVILVSSSYYQMHTKLYQLVAINCTRSSFNIWWWSWLQGCFFDIFKAFVKEVWVRTYVKLPGLNRVWHKGLKVEKNWISGELSTLIKDFLSLSKQRIVLHCQYLFMGWFQTGRSPRVNSRSFAVFNLH